MLNVPFESLALSVGVSAFANLLIIILFAQTTAYFTNRNDTGAVQAAHSKPTARIGGMGIFIALVAVAVNYHTTNIWGTYFFFL